MIKIYKNVVPHPDTYCIRIQYVYDSDNTMYTSPKTWNIVYSVLSESYVRFLENKFYQ